MKKVPTILIVEDEVPLLENMQMYFESHDCRVLRATSVDDALALLVTETPDVILLDLLLPNTLGTVLLESLQTEKRTIPVIVTTNTDSIGRREECMRLGARDFVIKSNVSLSYLLELVHRYLDECQKERKPNS